MCVCSVFTYVCLSYQELKQVFVALGTFGKCVESLSSLQLILRTHLPASRTPPMIALRNMSRKIKLISVPGHTARFSRRAAIDS